MNYNFGFVYESVPERVNQRGERPILYAEVTTTQFWDLKFVREGKGEKFNKEFPLLHFLIHQDVSKMPHAPDDDTKRAICAFAFSAMMAVSPQP